MARFEHVFADRREAGRRLAAELGYYRDQHPLVLALPRGGVPVAFEVAKALQAPLDLILVRKIGAPGQPELGLGALVDAEARHLVLNDDIIRMVAPAPCYIEAEVRRQHAEIEHQRQRYLRGGRPDVRGRVVIVVDDGLATGGTAKAALQLLGESDPACLVLALPVAPANKIDEMSSLADEFVCLVAPDPFRAISVHYEDFSRTRDEEIIRLLAESMSPMNGWHPQPRRWPVDTDMDDLVAEAGKESFPASDAPAF